MSPACVALKDGATVPPGWQRCRDVTLASSRHRCRQDGGGTGLSRRASARLGEFNPHAASASLFTPAWFTSPRWPTMSDSLTRQAPSTDKRYGEVSGDQRGGKERSGSALASAAETWWRRHSCLCGGVGSHGQCFPVRGLFPRCEIPVDCSGNRECLKAFEQSGHLPACPTFSGCALRTAFSSSV